VPGDDRPFRLLVIQPWTRDLKPLEASLCAAGLDATLTRVDFAAALDAALARERFDAAIFDPTTPGMTRETVDACIKLGGRDIPVIELDDVASIGARLSCLLETSRN
jgi:hypothetical protein